MSEGYKDLEKAAKKRPRVRPVVRNQMRMEVVDVEGLIEPDHPARAIWELSQQLDLESLYEEIEAVEGRAGRNPYDPRVLLCVWAYAYSRGWSSAREVSRLSGYEPGLRWLTGLEKINYHTLSDFRIEHQQELDQWLTELLGILHRQGLVSLQRVAQDGTRIQANAGGDSWSRKASLQKHMRVVAEQIRELNSPEYQQRTRREQQAKKRALLEKKKRLQRARRELEKLEKGKSRSREPRVSRTDPEARIMKKSDGGYGPSYNLQMATDEETQAVVAVEVCNHSSDVQQLVPLVEQIDRRLGHQPQQMLTDGGYSSAHNVKEMSERAIEYYSPLVQPKARGQLESRGVDPQFWPERFEYEAQTDSYRCPAGERLKFVNRRVGVGKVESRYRARRSVCQACRFKSRCCPQTRSHGRSVVRAEPTPAAQEFQQRMSSASGRQIYRRRGAIAEFPFAWIKEKMGVRAFRLRGLKKVRTEALWAAFAYNAQIWIRGYWKPQLS